MAFTMYPVTDMPRAVAFYQDVLGLKKSGVESEYWVEFDVDGETFGIGNFEQVGTPGTAASAAFEVEDIAAHRKQLADAGFEASEPHDLGKCFVSVVRDPDGNQVWLHQLKQPR
jgi:predicted enzyme related to lactoylglutathione lyase